MEKLNVKEKKNNVSSKPLGTIGLTKPNGDHKRGGRPHTKENRQVANSLMDAVANALRERSHLDLSLREIATEAGTSHTMIRYYFESKDGLLLAMIENISSGILEELKLLRHQIVDLPGSPTRYLVKCLITGIFRHPEIMRVAVTETGRNGSSIGERYLSHTVSRIFANFRLIIRDLMERGTYRQDLDLRYAVYTMTGLVTLGLIRIPTLPSLSLSLDDIQNERWIEFITSMLDSQFLNK